MEENKHIKDMEVLIDLLHVDLKHADINLMYANLNFKVLPFMKG